MCGISGITGEREELVHTMNRVTAHRGPDGSKVWASPQMTLGQNRLSIIDLRSIADQPFVSEDSRYITVFNGELYNFRELREELSQFTYRTEGDTEVLLNAYRAWGVECVKRFNGIFAFAIWDSKEQSLFVGRDQIGVKPLYYSQDGSRFVFSSEIKALLETGIKPTLNTPMFEKYLCLLYSPGEETLFQGVHRLAPGHTLFWKDGKVTLSAYYTVPEVAVDPHGSRATIEAKIRDTVDRAVQRQMVSDVPVGVYLSGGIDSTIITDAVSRIHSNIDTFSIGFDLEEGEESEKFNADFDLAQKTAQHYGTRHHGFRLESKDVVDLLEEHIWHLDEPVANLTALAQFKLSQYARQNVKVVLGGDGGDELFGGYKRHGYAKKLLPFWRLPASVRGAVPGRLQKVDFNTWSERYLFFLGQKDDVLKRLSPHVSRRTTVDYFHTEFFAHTTHESFLDDMMRADLSSWLVNESLLRSDKMAMAHGVEQRVPLLDIELVALARTISSSHKVTWFETKKILKDAFANRLPRHVFNQPKRGWISPGAKWLRRPEVQEYVKAVLSPGYYAPTAHLFNWPEIEKMYEAHTARTGYFLTPLWSVIAFQIWARRCNVQHEK